MKRYITWLLEKTITLNKVHPAAKNRPSFWATECLVPGIENCYKVNDRLYRGACPDECGNSNVFNIAKNVLCLKSFTGDTPVGRTWHVPMCPFWIEEKDVIEALRIIIIPELQPIFVHCQHGSDRTGLIIAMYRIVCEGWTKDDAIVEMTWGGYGFHPIFSNIIKFIKNADIDRIKEKVYLGSYELLK